MAGILKGELTCSLLSGESHSYFSSDNYMFDILPIPTSSLRKKMKSKKINTARYIYIKLILIEELWEISSLWVRSKKFRFSYYKQLTDVACNVGSIPQLYRG